MIIKSLSRKSPTFGQLANYMASEKSDERFDIHRNCYSRNHERIAAEFFENSKHLSKRKNSNFLYHEIISLSVPEGVDPSTFKEDLRDIVDLYVEARCSRNLVYGCLHEDHTHNLHYHLMISANERGEKRRSFLTKAEFAKVKKQLEAHVLKNYEHLQQKELIGAEKQGEKISMTAGEVQRRTGELPQRDEVKTAITEAMDQTTKMENFIFHLEENGYRFYIRGKNYGVEAINQDGKTKKYRFSTLGLHERLEEFIAYTERLAAEEKITEKAKKPSENLNQDEQKQSSNSEDQKAENRTLNASEDQSFEQRKEQLEKVKFAQNEKSSKVEPKTEAESETPKEDEVKFKDVVGVKQAYDQKKKQQQKEASASKQDVRNAAEKIRKDFEKMSAKKSQSQSDTQGQKK